METEDTLKDIGIGSTAEDLLRLYNTLDSDSKLAVAPELLQAFGFDEKSNPVIYLKAMRDRKFYKSSDFLRGDSYELTMQYIMGQNK